MADSGEPAFAVWITGLPASGKSTLARALKIQLATQGVNAAVLESDALRQVVSDQPRYDEQQRDAFYRILAYIGALLVEHGVPVIFDATANRREYRDRARHGIPRFMEVYVECPLETCMARDPKGIYRHALEGAATNVPGLQAAYEPPDAPDVLVSGDAEPPESGAARIIDKLIEKSYL